MPVTTSVPIVLGLAALGAAWLGPLPALAAHAFAAHMTIHIVVVAVAAPLLAIGLAGRTVDPAVRASWLFAPVAASIVDLAVVWAWHAPALHEAARQHTWAFAIEQGMFLAAGLWLWLSAVGGAARERAGRAWAGVGALLVTSMHMTLLGALFALTPRPLYAGHDVPGALADQHLGGAIMLLVGGAAYLAGGLWLTASLVRDGAPARRTA